LKFEGANAKTIEVRNVPLKIGEFRLYSLHLPQDWVVFLVYYRKRKITR